MNFSICMRLAVLGAMTSFGLLVQLSIVGLAVGYDVLCNNILDCHRLEAFDEADYRYNPMFLAAAHKRGAERDEVAAADDGGQYPSLRRRLTLCAQIWTSGPG